MAVRQCVSSRCPQAEVRIQQLLDGYQLSLAVPLEEFDVVGAQRTFRLRGRIRHAPQHGGGLLGLSSYDARQPHRGVQREVDMY